MKTIYIGTSLIDSIIKNINPEPVTPTGYVAESASLNIGGEAVNGSVTLSKLGGSVRLLAFLGSDAAGGIIKNALNANGVDTSLIVHPEGIPTPVSTLMVNEDGSRRTITNQAHRYNFHPENYLDCFDGADSVALTSLFRTPFNDPDVIYKTVRTAKEKGLTVYADTKLPNFNRLTLDDIKDSLPYIDYITPNEAEAPYYTGEDDSEKAADVFLKYGIKNAVIKLGSNGCLMKNADGVTRLPAFKIDAVDTTGSGDNFLAGLIYSGDLVFASACGAICATKVGATTAIKDANQVIQFIRNAQ